MFRSKKKGQEQATNEQAITRDGGTFSIVTDNERDSPRIAIPASRYEVTLKDASGEVIDEAWIEKQIESMNEKALGDTSGAFLDGQIEQAMRRALVELANIRSGPSGHVPMILANEAAEVARAEDLCRDIDGAYGALKALVN